MWANADIGARYGKKIRQSLSKWDKEIELFVSIQWSQFKLSHYLLRATLRTYILNKIRVYPYNMFSPPLLWYQLGLGSLFS